MACIGDRKVLRVAQDGSGHYSRVQDAIDAVPLCNRERIIIEVFPGVYRQPIYVPKTKNLITLRGFCAEDTVLTWNNTATRIEHHQKKVVHLRDCYIEGSVDFIFGNATSLLEHCHIHCKSQGYITAQSRKSTQESTGYVFLRCVITGNGGNSYMYLGRPWAPFGRVVFAYTWMDACIRPVGWNNWSKPENERSACFYEYRCTGPGSDPSKRVNWARQLMDDEAAQFVTHYFIDPDQQKAWLSKNLLMKIPVSA